VIDPKNIFDPLERKALVEKLRLHLETLRMQIDVLEQLESGCVTGKMRATLSEAEARVQALEKHFNLVN
jgi:hypothetical protein